MDELGPAKMVAEVEGLKTDPEHIADVFKGIFVKDVLPAIEEGVEKESSSATKSAPLR